MFCVDPWRIGCVRMCACVWRSCVAQMMNIVEPVPSSHLTGSWHTQYGPTASTVSPIIIYSIPDSAVFLKSWYFLSCLLLWVTAASTRTRHRSYPEPSKFRPYSISLILILILSSHLWLGLQSVLFLPGFSTKILYKHLYAHNAYCLPYSP
jgi:hypothetical protein